MKNPSIAILTSTFNPPLPIIKRCLDAVTYQNYNGVIRHYILDGGSHKEVIDLIHQYRTTILSFKNDPNEGLSRYHRALLSVREDIVLFLESDNIMTTSHWLSDMVLPFQEKHVFSTYSMHNGYESTDDILTRYFSLLGSPDPTLYYLKKSDKIRMDQTHYDKGTILKDTRKYSIVRFTEVNQPVMGDNGFMIYTNVLRYVVHKGKPFYHTDGYRQLLQMGYDTVGVVKNSIIHVSRPHIIQQVIRRVQVKQYFTDSMKGKRKFLVYNPASSTDRRNILLFILYSLTIIQPISLSIRGYWSKPDVAWFIHPIMCFLMVGGYGLSEISRMWAKITKSL